MPPSPKVSSEVDKVASIVDCPSEDLLGEPLDGLPETPTDPSDWDLLVVMYKKLATVWGDTERTADAAKALRRAAVIAEGRDPELAAHLAGLGVDALNPSWKELHARFVHQDQQDPSP